MTTRSGTTFKPVEGTTRILPAEGLTAHAKGMPAQGLTTMRYALPELSSLTEMVKTLLSDRERREKEIIVECERMDHLRQAQENEKCLAEIRRQMEHLQVMRITQLLDLLGLPKSHRSNKLTQLSEDDDVESYLTTFERIMAANEVAQDHWSYHLAPYLTGKAQQAFAALPPIDTKKYNKVRGHSLAI